MFTSSSAHKEIKTSDSNLNSLPRKGTKKRNPDEYFVLNGRRSPIVSKPWKYKSNSQLTLNRSSTEGSVSKSEIPISSTNQSDESNEYYESDEFTDGPEPELTRSGQDIDYRGLHEDSSWYLDPVHRSQNLTHPDLEELSRKRPLEASVVKSNMDESFYHVDEEHIKKTPIEAFDMSLFKNAENEMLSCRTITALTSPYQYKLAKLKMERLKIEEERLLQLKAATELERIRGPTPRWYEMRNAGFHVEAKKNNEMLTSTGNYKELMKYRHELLGTLEKLNATNDKQMCHDDMVLW